MEQLVWATGGTGATADSGAPRAGHPPAVDLLTNVREAAPTAAALARIVWATTRLSRGPGRLMPAEYFQHRLWDRRLMQGDPAQFVGLEAQGRFHRQSCDPGWLAIADDKLLTESVLRGAGIANLPETIAVVHPDRCLAGAAHLTARRDVAGYLGSSEIMPFVAKPIDGIFSIGVIHGVGRNDRGDAILTVDGGSETIEDVADRIVAHQAGYLIQRALRPAGAIGAMTGDRLCSVRALVFLTPAGPVFHRAALKIPVAGAMADNYWRPGNRIGAIDLATGEILRVMTGKASTLRRDPIHPDTGCPMEGATIPAWGELCALVSRAARLFPGIKTQSWDIAVTDRGPVLLELNWGGDLHLHQIAHGMGVLDRAYCSHLRACGFGDTLPE